MSTPPPPQRPDRMAAARAASIAARRRRREQGLAFARAWREQMRPYFDALYGPDEAAPRCCPACGRPSQPEHPNPGSRPTG